MKDYINPYSIPGLEADKNAREPKTFTVADIKRIVAETIEIDEQNFSKATKESHIAHMKFMAVYLCRKYLRMTCPVLAKEFGYRNHASVVHACQKVKNFLDTEPPFRFNLEKMQIRILAEYGR